MSVNSGFKAWLVFQLIMCPPRNKLAADTPGLSLLFTKLIFKHLESLPVDHQDINGISFNLIITVFESQASLMFA